ncbi:1-phosphofructokinase family hexose kinase [Gordonia soli]|uniref:1-phosphofructokinase n=1 Tax=Gordonia soli NBRC 108243 TaxID=1223545 RepID=M0QKG5_9ACTN|nr:hexose kinase [Gordonia soli]GAC68929.1 1-phosphofructokinase [Gordonia soli NBRC 108243]
MILTVTANPSLDRTIELPGPLQRGEVHRASDVHAQPGGKGVNVSRVVTEAGLPTRALLPARRTDPLLLALDAVGLPYQAVGIEAEVRSNITVAEPDGTTTKLNAGGTPLTAEAVAELTSHLRVGAREATWVALCGSLPPGLEATWYRELAAELADFPCSVAVDTSGAPLVASATGRADLLKPNVEELAEVTGADAELLETAVEAGDFGPVLAAAAVLRERTGATVLATLGGAGAVLLGADGAWSATPPPVTVRSTVGAGDASLAGYLIARSAGHDDAECLRYAVAYGSAAAALPGTQPPTPGHLDLDLVGITDVSSAASTG